MPNDLEKSVGEIVTKLEGPKKGVRNTCGVPYCIADSILRMPNYVQVVDGSTFEVRVRDHIKYLNDVIATFPTFTAARDWGTYIEIICCFPHTAPIAVANYIASLSITKLIHIFPQLFRKPFITERLTKIQAHCQARHIINGAKIYAADCRRVLQGGKDNLCTNDETFR